MKQQFWTAHPVSRASYLFRPLNIKFLNAAAHLPRPELSEQQMAANRPPGSLRGYSPKRELGNRRSTTRP